MIEAKKRRLKMKKRIVILSRVIKTVQIVKKFTTLAPCNTAQGQEQIYHVRLMQQRNGRLAIML